MNIGLFSKLILSFIILLFLSFLLPIIQPGNTAELLASATFLYGILYGFEISTVLSNFSQLKSLVAIENAGLISIFNLSKLISKDFNDQIGERIEVFLKRAIEVPLANHLIDTNKEFYEIFEPLKELKVEGHEKTAAINSINQSLYLIPQSRSQIAQVAPRAVNLPEWVMLLILALMLIAILFLGREANFISQLSVAIFATTVVGSLLILEEVDSNRIEEKKLEREVFNDSLMVIGRKEYYPNKSSN